MSGMLVAGGMFTSLAIGAMLVVAVAVLASATVLPRSRPRTLNLTGNEALIALVIDVGGSGIEGNIGEHEDQQAEQDDRPSGQSER